MRRRDGKELVAYLYAEDGISKPAEYYTNDGQAKTTTSTFGNFYIYLYDPATGKFFPNKIAPFYSIQGFSMYLGRSDFTVLHHNKKGQSDILLIGVRVNSNGDQYEAYGFSEDLSTLKKYRFTIKEKKSPAFYGRLWLNNNEVYAYNKHENIDEDEKIRGKIEQFKFQVSNMPGEIRIEPLRINNESKEKNTNSATLSNTKSDFTSMPCDVLMLGLIKESSFNKTFSDKNLALIFGFERHGQQIGITFSHKIGGRKNNAVYANFELDLVNQTLMNIDPDPEIPIKINKNYVPFIADKCTPNENVYVNTAKHPDDDNGL